jgi:hypothetical protein
MKRLESCGGSPSDYRLAEEVPESAGLLCLDVGHESVTNSLRLRIEATFADLLEEQASLGFIESDTDTASNVARLEFNGTQVAECITHVVGCGRHCN